MPSFSFSSSIRAVSQEYVLRLKITHNLTHGSPSDSTHSIGGRVPKELDILWLSDVTISLSGSLGTHKIPAHEIACSGLAQHLHAQLKMNADQLGLNNVSRPFVDDTDGLPKLTLTPSRPLPQPSRAHASLVSLHLTYICRSVPGRNDVDSPGRLLDEAGPFSPTLFLPVEALLNRITEQFLTYHLVNRYPLIFGTWCKRLDLEMSYFPSIGNSITEIMARSENRGFLSKCRRLLKIAHSHHKTVLKACAAALSTCIDDGVVESQRGGIDHPTMPVLTDEQILCESLEQLFRMGVRPRRFKPTATPKFVSFPQDGDDALLQAVGEQRSDDENPWVELSDVTGSPGAILADCYQMEPEDMHTKEDCPEGGMWRFHETDTSPVDVLAPFESIMCEPQSDESLIDSLPSITTRSTQACSFTLYRHQDDDYSELDTGTSGLDDDTQMTHLEGPGASALFASPSRSSVYAPCDLNFEQLTWGCQDDFECFETLDSCSELGEVGDSDSILLDPDVEGAGHAANEADTFDWLV